MAETFKLFRFSIPPFVFLFFVILAVLFNPDIKQNLEPGFNIEGTVLEVLVGAAAILALGFIISSVANFFLRVIFLMFGLAAGHRPNWNKEAQKKIKEQFDLCVSRGVDQEVFEWLIHDRAPDNVQSNIQKRWEMFLINYHSIFALIFTWLFLWYRNALQDIGKWRIIFFLLLLIFLANAIANWWDIRKIDHFLLEHSKKLREKQEGTKIKTGSDLDA